LSLKNFLHIHINTNGIFSNEVEDILYKAGPKISLFFNISTPGFIFKKDIRNLVLKRIKKLSLKCPTTLVITSSFFSDKEAKEIINMIDKKILQKVKIRLGVQGVVVGEKNYMNISQFSHIGNNFFKVFRYIKRLNQNTIIVLAKSIVPCMFTNKQRQYLKKFGYLKQFHCHPESEGLWFSINPSLETFMCYPLSTIYRLKITEKSNFKEIKDFYQKLLKDLDKKYVLPECKKCPFYGLENGRCPGPCLGFRINALKLPAIII
jgi:hypothetical protein